VLFCSFSGFAAQNGGLAYTSNGTLLGWQCIAVLCVVVYSAIITYTICKVADFFCDGLRVSDEDEKHGLDRGEHTELGHHFLDFNIISDAAAHADAAAGGHSQCGQSAVAIGPNRCSANVAAGATACNEQR
jgi:hypothetical protein